MKISIKHLQEADHLDLKLPALIIGLNLFFAATSAYSVALVFNLWLLSQRVLSWKLFLPLPLMCLWMQLHFKHPEGKFVGEGRIHIESVLEDAGPFGRAFVYRGTLKEFSHSIKNARFTWRSKKPVLANRDYVIKGEVQSLKGPYYRINKVSLETVPWTYSLAEAQFRARKAVKSWMKERFSDPQVASFLAAISTGDLSERLISLDFKRAGLMHLMCVSGFHFSLLAAFFSRLLSCFFYPRRAAYLLIVVLSSYFLLIGGGPSMWRAWLSATAALCAQLIGRQSIALNTLGVALSILLIYDPLLAGHLGFQFSFLATGGILCLFGPLSRWLRPLFFTEDQVVTNLAARLDGRFLLLGFMHQSLSLSLAVHLAICPLIFLYFGEFNLIALLYNIFYPALVSFALILLFVPPLYFFLEGYTSFLLRLVQGLPVGVDFTVRLSEVPVLVWSVYWLILLILGLSAWKRQDDFLLL